MFTMISDDTMEHTVDCIMDAEKMELMLARDQRTILSLEVRDTYVPTSLTDLKSRRTESRKPRESVKCFYVKVKQSKTEVKETTTERNKLKSYLTPEFYDDRGTPFTKRACRKATFLTKGLDKFLFILLALHLVKCSKAAPIMSNETQPGRWINPCGFSSEEVIYDDPEMPPLPTDAQLMEHVISQTKMALSFIEHFRDDYVEKTFKMGYDLFYHMWRQNRYEWLPGPLEIPKELGNTLNDDYLRTLDLDTTIIKTYNYMQKYAVGLEQIVADQKNLSYPLCDKFEKVQQQNQMILCEMYVVLSERGLTQLPDVSRDIMPMHIRRIELQQKAAAEMRDWIIFRDYNNALEYVEQVFTYLLKHAFGTSGF